MERGKVFLTTLMMEAAREVVLRKSPQDSGQRITVMMLKSSFKRFIKFYSM